MYVHAYYVSLVIAGSLWILIAFNGGPCKGTKFLFKNLTTFSFAYRNKYQRLLQLYKMACKSGLYNKQIRPVQLLQLDIHFHLFLLPIHVISYTKNRLDFLQMSFT